MSSKQKTEESCPTESKTESQSPAEAPYAHNADTDGEATYRDLMRKVLDDDNIEQALKQVVANKGAPGVDGMTVDELMENKEALKAEITTAIMEGKYRPKPVRRVEIPKPDGGVRKLGVPTVQDRLVQQMVAQVLTPIFDPTFSDSSYGFRPGRSAHDAIGAVMDLYDDGYVVAVSIDLSKYFDTIPQDKLLNMLRKTIKDDALIELIKRFLKSGVALPDGLVGPTPEGSPQGGPLSPLLSNIYLDRFDKEMERRGLHFVRYADDANIYVRTERAAERVMESATSFLEDILKLKVNRDKSKIGSPMELKYLGFKLGKDEFGNTIVVPHEKSIQRFKIRQKEILRRYRGDSLEKILKEWKRYAKGWMAYFGTGPFELYRVLDAHARRRVRAILLRQWKTPKNRQKQLRRIGNLPMDGIMMKRMCAISYCKHLWKASGHSVNFVLTNSNLQAETGMYYMTDDWIKVQERFSRSPLRVRTVGSVGGRQSTLLEF